jgi:hypothetical protein
VNPDEGSSTPRRSRGLAAVELDGDLVVYDPADQVLHVLNPAAALVWDRCDGTTTVAEIVAELSRWVARPATDLAGEIAAAVADLRHLGLVDSDPPAPRA